jgi:hypothetical protein
MFEFTKSKFIKSRIFAGTIIYDKSYLYGLTSLYNFGYSFWGYNDYTFSDTYFDRSFASPQTYINDGGVRNKFDNYYSYMANMLAINTSMDLLPKGIVSIYFDCAYSKSHYVTNPYLAWERNFYNGNKWGFSLSKKFNLFYIASGIRIALIPDYVEFYVPFYLYETVQGKRAFKDTWKNVNILINLTKLNPFDAARKAYD